MVWACSGSLDAHVIHRGVSQRTGHGAGVVAAAGCERHGGDRQPLVIEQHGPRGCGGRRWHWQRFWQRHWLCSAHRRWRHRWRIARPRSVCPGYVRRSSGIAPA